MLLPQLAAILVPEEIVPAPEALPPRRVGTLHAGLGRVTSGGALQACMRAVRAASGHQRGCVAGMHACCESRMESPEFLGLQRVEALKKPWCCMTLQFRAGIR